VVYRSRNESETAVKHSQVHLQWDTDHHPSGAKLERWAIQLDLRGQMLANYPRPWIIQIEDISEFVLQQRQNLKSHYLELITPQEKVYPVFDSKIQAKLGLSACTE
jgi:hypothetical protein